MGQSVESKILNQDPVLQQELIISEQQLLGKAQLLRKTFRESIPEQAQINDLFVHFSAQSKNSSEKVLEHLRKHVNSFHVAHVQARFSKKLNSIAVDEAQLSQMYVINSQNTLSLVSYCLSDVQLTSEDRLYLILYSIEKIPITKESLPIALAFLEEAAPPKDSVSLQILEDTEFIDKLVRT